MLRKLLGLLRPRKKTTPVPPTLRTRIHHAQINAAPLTALLDKQPGARSALRALALVERTIILSHKESNPLPLLQPPVLKRAIIQLTRLQSALDDDVGLLLYRMRKQDAQNDKNTAEETRQDTPNENSSFTKTIRLTPTVDLSQGDLRFEILSHLDFEPTRPFAPLDLVYGHPKTKSRESVNV